MDLSDLPTPSDKRIAVRVSRDALRHLRSGHPWVYDGSITSVGHEGESGDLAVVFDNDRNFAGIGLWDPESPIRIKMLHAGKPATIDASWWRDKLATAIGVRSPLWPATTGYRVVNGESDGFPGLVLDRYADVLVIKVYTGAWLPHLASIVAAIDELLTPTALVLRLGRRAQREDLYGLDEGQSLIGPTQTEPVVFVENGLHFEADVINGQKTGHFLDQRDNRQRVRELAAGKSVLDVFSCTGGFSLYAAAGGARSVHSVDIAPGAMQTAVRNFELNAQLPEVARCDHRTTVDDAFAVLRKLAEAGDRYDVVVIDPPSFASKQSSVEAGLHSYRQLTMLAMPLLARGGLLVQASCSSRVDADRFFATVHDGAATANTTLAEIERTGHGVDHPATFPEAQYLKALFARAD